MPFSVQVGRPRLQSMTNFCAARFCPHLGHSPVRQCLTATVVGQDSFMKRNVYAALRLRVGTPLSLRGPRGFPLCRSVTRGGQGGPLVRCQGATTPVVFKTSKQLAYGEQLKVVGKAFSLGAWNVKQAPALVWGEGDVWSLTLELSPATYAFKLVIFNEATAQTNWEAGDDRLVEVRKGQSGSVEVQCVFGDTSSTKVTCTGNTHQPSESVLDLRPQEGAGKPSAAADASFDPPAPYMWPTGVTLPRPLPSEEGGDEDSGGVQGGVFSQRLERLLSSPDETHVEEGQQAEAEDKRDLNFYREKFGMDSKIGKTSLATSMYNLGASSSNSQLQEQKVRDLQAELRRTENIRMRLKEELSKVVVQSIASQKEVSKLQSEVQQLLQQRNSTLLQLSSMQSAVKESSKEVNALKTKIEDTEHQLRTQTSALQQQVGDLENERQHSWEEVAHLRSTLEEKEGELKAQTAALREHIWSLEDEKASMVKEVSRLTTQLEETEQALLAQKNQLQHTIWSLEEEKAGVLQQVQRLQQQLSEKDDELKSQTSLLRQNVLSLEEDKEQLQTQIAQLKTQLEEKDHDLKLQTNELRTIINELDSEKQRTLSEMERLKATIEEKEHGLEAQREQLQRAIVTLEEEKASTAVELVRLKDSLVVKENQMKAEHHRLHNTIATLEAERADAMNEIGQLHEALQHVTAGRQRALDDVSTLKDTLNQKELEWQIQVTSLQRTVNELQSQVDSGAMERRALSERVEQLGEERQQQRQAVRAAEGEKERAIREAMELRKLLSREQDLLLQRESDLRLLAELEAREERLVRDLQGQVRYLESELSQMSHDRDRLRQEVGYNAHTADQLMKQLAATEAQLLRVQQQIDERGAAEVAEQGDPASSWQNGVAGFFDMQIEKDMAAQAWDDSDRVHWWVKQQVKRLERVFKASDSHFSPTPAAETDSGTSPSSPAGGAAPEHTHWYFQQEGAVSPNPTSSSHSDSTALPDLTSSSSSPLLNRGQTDPDPERTHWFFTQQQEGGSPGDQRTPSGDQHSPSGDPERSHWYFEQAKDGGPVGSGRGEEVDDGRTHWYFQQQESTEVSPSAEQELPSGGHWYFSGQGGSGGSDLTWVGEHAVAAEDGGKPQGQSWGSHWDSGRDVVSSGSWDALESGDRYVETNSRDKVDPREAGVFAWDVAASGGSRGVQGSGNSWDKADPRDAGSTTVQEGAGEKWTHWYCEQQSASTVAEEEREWESGKGGQAEDAGQLHWYFQQQNIDVDAMLGTPAQPQPERPSAKQPSWSQMAALFDGNGGEPEREVLERTLELLHGENHLVKEEISKIRNTIAELEEEKMEAMMEVKRLMSQLEARAALAATKPASPKP